MARRANIEWWGEELSVAVLIGSAAASIGDSPESLLQRAQDALKEDKACSHVVAVPGANPSSAG